MSYRDCMLIKRAEEEEDIISTTREVLNRSRDQSVRCRLLLLGS